ncbi:sulfatase [Nonomuraea sp. NPDC051941]|uniref:sulfatase n=1 Tax=Nonomuraea sp. NPDC051941 TaxID=3364373 RepID=UPI0037CAEC9D
MPKQPNVLLIVADQHRYDWIEGTGDLPVRTPHLRRLAERGMTFRRAVTPAPLCAPARACLATGLDYDSGPVPSNFHDLPPEARTYFRTLRDEAGYHVAGVGKFDLHKATFDWNLDGSRCLSEWGLDGGIDNEGKFDSLWSGRTGPKGPYMNHLYGRGVACLHLRDFERRRHEPYFDVEPSPLPEDAYLDNWIARNARDVLSSCPQGRPWHVVVNFAGPHDPMDVPPGLIDRWRDVEFPVPAGQDPADPRHQEVRRRYAAMIENIDGHVGGLLDLIAERGELENTVVVYTSDHGEMLGDQGIWGKQVALDPSIRIPMIIAGPVVRHPGLTSDALVSLEDLAATFLDVAGLAPAQWMTARSLLPVVRGETPEHRDHVVSGLDRSAREIELAQRHYGDNRWVALRRWRAVSTRTRKLVVSADLPAPALFDLESDPYETTDLAGSEPATVRELLACLDDDLVATLLCRRGSSTASSETADHDDVREKSDG